MDTKKLIKEIYDGRYDITIGKNNEGILQLIDRLYNAIGSEFGYNTVDGVFKPVYSALTKMEDAIVSVIEEVRTVMSDLEIDEKDF